MIQDIVKFWIGVVSLNHVERGVAGGFAQVCHGKSAPLRCMRQGDVLFYYSPKTAMNDGKLLQCFTAVGEVISEQPYQFRMSTNFIPYRVDVAWFDCIHAPIAPLIPVLSFIEDVRHWGYPFKRGHFEITPDDAHCIALAMRAPLAHLFTQPLNPPFLRADDEQGQFTF